MEDDRSAMFIAEVIAKYGSDTDGVWCVRGADSNCDLSGSHYMPILGYYRGKLIDVARLAIELDSFWSWGAGDITPIQIVDVTELNVVNLKKLRIKERELEAELKEVKTKLKGIK